MTSRIDHIGIFVSDLEAAITLFSVSFGLEVESRIDMPDKGVHAAFLPWGDVSIELLSPSDPARRAALSAVGGPIHHFAVSVTDLDATLARLADADLPAAGAPQELGGRRAVFLDTEALMNVRIQLIESS